MPNPSPTKPSLAKRPASHEHGHDFNVHPTTGRHYIAIMIMDIHREAAPKRLAATAPAAASPSSTPMSFPSGLPYLPTDTRHSSMSLSRPSSVARLPTHDSISISSQRTKPSIPALPHGFSGRPAYNSQTPSSGRADTYDRARQSTSSYGTDHRKSYDRSLRTPTGSMKDGQEPYSLGNFVFEASSVPPLPALPPTLTLCPSCAPVNRNPDRSPNLLSAPTLTETSRRRLPMTRAMTPTPMTSRKRHKTAQRPTSKAKTKTKRRKTGHQASSSGTVQTIRTTL